MTVWQTQVTIMILNRNTTLELSVIKFLESKYDPCIVTYVHSLDYFILGNSMKDNVGCQFSTHEMDNDHNKKTNCAEYLKGAWWYDNCTKSNLNGEHQSETFKAVRWDH